MKFENIIINNINIININMNNNNNNNNKKSIITNNSIILIKTEEYK